MLQLSKLRKYALSCAAVVPVLVLGLPETVDRRPECVRAQAWAAAHRDGLPTTLEALSAFPPAHRQAIFSALPHETKAALWRARLDARLADPAQRLTSVQRQLMQEARAFLSAETYRTRHVPDGWRARAAQAFDRQAFAQAFRGLAEGEGRWTPASAGVLAAERWHDLMTAQAKPICDCWDNSDCSGGATCRFSPCSLDFGCGPFDFDQCVGVCR